MVIGDVLGNGRMGPACDDDPHAWLRILGQQGGDAVGVATSVLVEPVDHEDQALATARAVVGGLPEHAQQMCLDGRAADLRQRLPEQVGELLDDHGEESSPVVLVGEAGGDEERHHPHAGGRVQDEGRQQRGLAGPCGGLPPLVRRRDGRGGAEARQFRQLTAAVVQGRRGDAPDLVLVVRLGRAPATEVHAADVVVGVPRHGVQCVSW
ncbi:hypothetical protein ACFFG9_42995 [Kutzneria buriramensis]